MSRFKRTNNSTRKRSPLSNPKLGKKQVRKRNNNGNWNAKKERFCHEYLVDLNEKKASERAGYSNSNGTNAGARLMKEEGVRARIAVLAQERACRVKVSADRVIQEVAAIAFFNRKDYYDENGQLKPISSLSYEECAAIKTTKTRFLFKKSPYKPGEIKEAFGGVEEIEGFDKLAALKLLGEHLGMFDSKFGDQTNHLHLHEVRLNVDALKMLPKEQLEQLANIIRTAAIPSASAQLGYSGAGAR